MGELDTSNKDQYEYVEENGARYRVPYQKVRRVTFSKISKDEIKDIEHSARLQYRLLLLDAILDAKVEFVTRKITLVYNPTESRNKMAKTSISEIINFLGKEGVHVSNENAKESDVDYYTEIYSRQYNPPLIREHPPYGYTVAEWKKLKPSYERKKTQKAKKNSDRFREWQIKYLETHPELAAELGLVAG
jgi:hypothetical protein